MLSGLLKQTHLEDKETFVVSEVVIAPIPFGYPEEYEKDTLLMVLDKGLIVGRQVVIPGSEGARCAWLLEHLLQFMKPGKAIDARQVLLALLQRPIEKPSYVLGDFFEV
jgi:hypothetical protein